MWWEEHRNETRDHPFFFCPYFYIVWKRLVMRVLGTSTKPTLATDVIAAAAIAPQSKWYSRLLSIAYGGNAMFIATTWNGQLTWIVDKELRNRIVSLKYKLRHQLVIIVTHRLSVSYRNHLYILHRFYSFVNAYFYK